MSKEHTQTEIIINSQNAGSVKVVICKFGVIIAQFSSYRRVYMIDFRWLRRLLHDISVLTVKAVFPTPLVKNPEANWSKLSMHQSSKNEIWQFSDGGYLDK